MPATRKTPHERFRPAGWSGEHWSTAIVTEHLATRNSAALFDESSFAKIEIAGRGAAGLLESLCDNRVDRPVGSITCTSMLNSRGGEQLTVEVFGHRVDPTVVAQPLYDPDGARLRA